MEKPTARKLETTLEDLIAAASEVAFEYSENDKDAYSLARLALIELIRKTAQKADLNKELESLPSLSPLVH